jgi:hypothetical protein
MIIGEEKACIHAILSIIHTAIQYLRASSLAICSRVSFSVIFALSVGASIMMVDPSNYMAGLWLVSASQGLTQQELPSPLSRLQDRQKSRTF